MLADIKLALVMSPAKNLQLLAAVLATSLPGCTVGPDYVRPSDDVPASFTTRPGLEPVSATTPWWQTLHDPLLNELTSRARRANPGPRPGTGSGCRGEGVPCTG